MSDSKRFIIWLVGAGVLPFCTVWLDLKLNGQHGGAWSGLALIEQMAMLIWLIISDKSRWVVALVCGVACFVLFWIATFFFALNYVCENYGNCL